MFSNKFSSFLLIFSLPLSFLFLSSNHISKAGANEAKEIKIIASFYPAYIMAKNVAKDAPGVLVQSLTPALTGCLHDYTVTTNDIRKLADAQVLVVNGAGMEAFLDRITVQYPNLRIIRLSEGIPLIKDKGNAGDNPHVWVSVSNAIIQVKNLGREIARFDPARKELYEKNTASYVAKLETLREKMRSELAPYKGRSIITFHEAFPYFAREFGFKILAVVERDPASEPSAKELSETIDLIRSAAFNTPPSVSILSTPRSLDRGVEGLIKKNRIPALFSEPQYPAAAAGAIARETGAKVYVLDPAVTGPDDNDAYINIMEDNLKTLKLAFQK